MIRSVIIDDEKLGREVLKTDLQHYCNDVLVMEMADSAKSGRRIIEKHNPDLVFLDIEMPNGSGFDLLRSFEKIFFKVIFVTAHNEFALNAFRFSATDYLTKPVGPRELRDAVSKVNREIQLEINSGSLETLLKFAEEPDNSFESIVIPNIHGFLVEKISDILYCQADTYITRFQMIDGRTISSSHNLKYYEDLLNQKCFLRVHNSYLINLNHVKSFDNDGTVLLSCKYSAPVGNTYRRRFLDYFMKMR